MLEYWLDGTTWVDILAGSGAIPANPARFITGGYTGPLNTSAANPIGGRPAWYGNNGASFTPVRVNLSDFAGVPVRFRFRFGSDGSVAVTGWWINDVRVASPTACTPGRANRVFADGFEG